MFLCEFLLWRGLGTHLTFGSPVVVCAQVGKRISRLIVGWKGKKNKVIEIRNAASTTGWPPNNQRESTLSHMVASVFTAQGERRGLMIHLLTCWLVGERGILQYAWWLVGGVKGPSRGGVKSGPHTFSSRGQEGVGQVAQGGGGGSRTL